MKMHFAVPSQHFRKADRPLAMACDPFYTPAKSGMTLRSEDVTCQKCKATLAFRHLNAPAGEV